MHQIETNFSQIEAENAKLESDLRHLDSQAAKYAKLYEQETNELHQKENENLLLQTQVSNLENELSKLQNELVQVQSNTQMHSEQEIKKLELLFAEQKEKLQSQLIKKEETIKLLEYDMNRLKSQGDEQNRVQHLNLQNEIASLKAQLKSQVEKEVKIVQEQLEEQRLKNDVSFNLICCY